MLYGLLSCDVVYIWNGFDCGMKIMSLVCVIYVLLWIFVFIDSISVYVMVFWVCGVFDEE